MKDVEEFEHRLSAALARIKAGVDKIQTEPPIQASTDEASQVAELTARLEEEQMINAQLEGRVKLLKERQDGQLAELQQRVDASEARAGRFDRDLQRLRAVNADLREINDNLRQAVEQGVSEPHLVNKAMLAELEALRAVRSADAAEMDAILEALTPIIRQEADNAAG